MPTASLEHANITVSDARKTADMLCEVFRWHIRWQGASLLTGESVHVGTDDTYLALYSPESVGAAQGGRQATGHLNHVGIVVDNLAEIEARVDTFGFAKTGRETYEPGERFYFFDHDGVEFEVVSYA